VQPKGAQQCSLELDELRMLDQHLDVVGDGLLQLNYHASGPQ
jgi:hypothetical protein